MRALGSFVLILSVGCGVAAEDRTTSEPSALGAAPGHGALSQKDGPPELHEVKAGLYRGGHPDHDGLVYLQGLGVNTIVSLQWPGGSVVEGDKAAEVAAEEKDAAELGFKYVSIPMSSWSNAGTYDGNWDEVRPYVESASGTYVHCQHGHDRTGLVMALERVLVEGWDAQRAHDELMELGHSRVLIRIDNYFWSKTGSGEQN